MLAPRERGCAGAPSLRTRGARKRRLQRVRCTQRVDDGRVAFFLFVRAKDVEHGELDALRIKIGNRAVPDWARVHVATDLAGSVAQHRDAFGRGPRCSRAEARQDLRRWLLEHRVRGGGGGAPRAERRRRCRRACRGYGQGAVTRAARAGALRLARARHEAQGHAQRADGQGDVRHHAILYHRSARREDGPDGANHREAKLR